MQARPASREVRCLLAATNRCPAPLPLLPQALDGLLLAHGSSQGGDYFAGGHYTLAEVVATTLLQRAVLVLPAHRGIDVWQLIRDAKLDRWGWLPAGWHRSGLPALAACPPPCLPDQRSKQRRTKHLIQVPYCPPAAAADRLESWLQAALARPSAAETQPDAKAVIATFAAFVAPLKQEEEAPEADKAAPAAEKPGRLARLASVMPGRKHAAPSA